MSQSYNTEGGRVRRTASIVNSSYMQVAPLIIRLPLAMKTFAAVLIDMLYTYDDGRNVYADVDENAKN